MTNLINLESYLECCQYAHLFGESVAKLTPNPKSLPNVYRDFCKKYLSQKFLPLPALALAQPQTLSLRTKPLSQSTSQIGITIDDQCDNQIFIVREANSLAMRSFDVPQYLYANVYRYWSYADQLKNLTTSNKPLVIYDLDSFTPAQIIPFNFESSLNATYRIPIIDTRSKSQYDSLKLSKPYEDIYKNICDYLADKIVCDLGIGLENIIAVSHYIQKINLFQKVIPQCSGDRIPLIIEIADTFYPYNLNLDDLEAIVYRNLPITELQNIITQNSDSYNFALVSSVIQSPRIKQYLQQQFSGRFSSILDTSKNIFHQIWQEKNKQKLPLYGQHLDSISFFVTKDKETMEISLPSSICYEGEQEKVQYASYLKNNKEEQEFTLPAKSVNLQFKINDKPFVSNETDIEQSYVIENQYFQEAESKEIKIKIRFRTKPGTIPKLEVLDNQNRILHSKLADYEQPIIQSSGTSGFLPIAQILQSRNEKSNKGLEIMLGIEYLGDLKEFASSLESMSQNVISKETIAKRISSFRAKWKTQILPIFVLPSNQNELIDILHLYKSIAIFSKNIFLKLIPKKDDDGSIKTLINKSYSDLILIISDSYAMTQLSNLDFLHSTDILSRKEIKQWDERLRSNAKTACIQSRQISYFNLFHRYSQRRDSVFYKNDVYVWGYARTLMWYVNFEDPLIANICKQHFGNLVNYCYNLELSIPKNISYLRDALITLIYLLTFRESDPNFVKKDSPLYREAKSLCRRLDSHPIRSQKTTIDIPLNSFFDQILDGNVTQEQMISMIQID